MTNTEIVHPSDNLPSMLTAEELPSADCNPYFVYVRSLDSIESTRTMRECLDRLASMATGVDGPPPPWSGQAFTWHLLRHQHTAALRARMHVQTSARSGNQPKPWSPAYINKHIAALRGVLKAAWKLEAMSTDDYMRAVAIDLAKGRREPVGRSIQAPEFAAMLAACLADLGPAGRRDAAMIGVLHSTGVRRAELVSIARDDYDAGTGSIRLIGKGNKQRTVYVHQDATCYVTSWLKISEHVRGPLFCPVDRWGNIVDRRMTPRVVADTVNRRRLEAGLAPLSPHDFRRTFAGDMLDSGADLVQVKGLLGHESADVTARYDRRPERARQAAVNRLSLPSPESLRDAEPLPHDERNEQ